MSNWRRMKYCVLEDNSLWFLVTKIINGHFGTIYNEPTICFVGISTMVNYTTISDILKNTRIFIR